MKVKAISRTETEFTRDSKTSIYKLSRNLDPKLHPLAKPREFVRAMNAAKLDRMMAKPFIHALSGHRDGVYAMCKHPTILNRIFSGAADGEVRVWCLSSRQTVYSVPHAHQGMVKGIVAVPTSHSLFLSCGSDKTLKWWNTDESWSSSSSSCSAYSPVRSMVSKHGFTCLDHHRVQPQFITGGNCVQVWDHHSYQPLHTFTWDNDTLTNVKYNPSEVSIFASTSTDRSITFYDMRMQSPLRKLVLAMTSNAVCWNPMIPFQFAVANEDHNVYLFDMRKLDRSTNVLRDHVSAVLDVDYSSTGQFLVTGAYDRTLRRFSIDQGHSLDVYHTQRMQRIWKVQYSMDSHYLISASDDGNVRLWKANASEKLGGLSHTEQHHLNVSKALVQKYAHVPSVRKIALHRPTPKPIVRASKLKQRMMQARQQKEINAAMHSKRSLHLIPAREKPVLGVQL